MLISSQINSYLKEKEKSIEWLAEKLWLNKDILKARMKDNIWMVGDIIRLKNLGCIKD